MNTTIKKELLKQKLIEYAKNHKLVKNIREYPNKVTFDYLNNYVNIGLVKLCSQFNDCLIGTNQSQPNHLIIKLWY